MNTYDQNRPYADQASMDFYTAIKKHIALRYGKKVRAMELSNREYLRRFHRLARENNMKPPPGSEIHIMPGYLVVRKLGSVQQYETWIPDYVFEELNAKDHSPKLTPITTPPTSVHKVSAASSRPGI
jgi:hypothetical protein